MTAVPLFCSPWEIRTVKHILYRNNGDGTFTDVTDRAGLGRSDGHGFGVVAADLNGDGRVDLYVANDLNPNFLFLNRGDGTFEDATETSGAAFDERGLAQSSMGVDAEDCDGDGRPELLVTNFQNEYIAYLSEPVRLGSDAGRRRDPPVLFRDSSAAVGLVADSKPWVGWGCALADFDNDGWPDGFVANGHIDDEPEGPRADHELSRTAVAVPQRPGRWRRDGRHRPSIRALHPRRGPVFRHETRRPRRRLRRPG